MKTQSSDPFDLLAQAASRVAHEEVAAKLISTARTKLVLDRDAKAVFFATLALGLKTEPVWDEAIETMATDGRSLFYNPEWAAALPLAEAIGVIAHEVCHVCFKHHARRAGRNPRKFNIATDLAINDILKDAGYKLPACGIFPGKSPYEKLPKGLSAEEYYKLLPDEPEGDEGDKGGGSSDPGGCGKVIDAGDGSPAAQREAEAEATVSVAQAANAAKQSGRGTLPAGIARLVEEALTPQVDWRNILRDFIGKHLAKDDYSWTTPNRRFIAQGLYLPGVRSEAKPTVALLVDTSGSIGEKELRQFGGELAGLLEASPCKLWVGYHHTNVYKTQEWTPSDGELVLEGLQSGGTCHREPFKRIEQDDVQPDCVVCLTDMQTSYPDSPPPWPVVWCSIDKNGKAPFGEVIYID